MILKFINLAAISALFITQCIANLPEDPAEYEAWEAKLLIAVEAQVNSPPEQAIPKLGRWIAQLSDKGSPNFEKGNRPVFHAAQAALLAIPGHAEHYRNRVLKAKEERKATFGTLDYGRGINDYLTERNQARRILQHLPSPETVTVLGDFLSDVEEGVYPIQDQIMEGPLACVALEALIHLPLVNKPTSFDRPPSEEDLKNVLPVWQGWYEQIKSGKRTFRFEGDSTEYDLNGPAPGQKLAHISRDRKRDDERVAGQKKSSPTAVSGEAPAQIGKPLSIAGIIAAVALCAAAFWYFLSGRKPA